MDFVEVKITTTTEGIEGLCNELMDIGITGFVIEDKQDFTDFLEDTTIYWDYVEESLMEKQFAPTKVIVYLSKDKQGQLQREQIDILRKKLGEKDSVYGSLAIEESIVEEKDWANHWKQYFKPIRVGDRFLIKPTWEPWEDWMEDYRIIEIDPNASFGTGQHETTQLCLTELEQLVNPEDVVLDLGCGSGILSIAMARLGAKELHGIDIELHAVNTARENFYQNISQEIPFTGLFGNVLTEKSLQEQLYPKGYDLIAANIVADVILSMKSIFPLYLKDKGHLVVSGIIDNREEEVRNALTATGLKFHHKTTQSDWVAMVFTK